MKAHDIMTRDVATVKPHTPTKEIAVLMIERQISGVPVVDDNGRIVGIVSESDLLRRTEVGTQSKRKWWSTMFADANETARAYVKAHGFRAHDVMSRNVISVQHDANLSEVADILEHHHIKRVVVLRNGSLAGIVSRGDLVRALVNAKVTKSDRKLENAALHKLLRERMRSQPWLKDCYLNVSVSDGVVDLWGLVTSFDQHRALLTLVEDTDGVRRIEDRLCVSGSLRSDL